MAQRGTENDSGPTTHLKVSRSKTLVILPCACTSKVKVIKTWEELGGGGYRGIKAYNAWSVLKRCSKSNELCSTHKLLYKKKKYNDMLLFSCWWWWIDWSKNGQSQSAKWNQKKHVTNSCLGRVQRNHWNGSHCFPQSSSTALCWLGALKLENFSLLLEVKRFNGQWMYYAEHWTQQITWQTKKQVQRVKGGLQTRRSPVGIRNRGAHRRITKISLVEELICLSLATMIF